MNHLTFIPPLPSVPLLLFRATSFLRVSFFILGLVILTSGGLRRANVRRDVEHLTNRAEQVAEKICRLNGAAVIERHVFGSLTRHRHGQRGRHRHEDPEPAEHRDRPIARRIAGEIFDAIFARIG